MRTDLCNFFYQCKMHPYSREVQVDHDHLGNITKSLNGTKNDLSRCLYDLVSPSTLRAFPDTAILASRQDVSHMQVDYRSSQIDQRIESLKRYIAKIDGRSRKTCMLLALAANKATAVEEAEHGNEENSSSEDKCGRRLYKGAKKFYPPISVSMGSDDTAIAYRDGSHRLAAVTAARKIADSQRSRRRKEIEHPSEEDIHLDAENTVEEFDPRSVLSYEAVSDLLAHTPAGHDLRPPDEIFSIARKVRRRHGSESCSSLFNREQTLRQLSQSSGYSAPHRPFASIKDPYSYITASLDHTVEDEANENEPRYCVCNQIAFGNMIGCDNSKCPIGKILHRHDSASLSYLLILLCCDGFGCRMVS